MYTSKVCNLNLYICFSFISFSESTDLLPEISDFIESVTSMVNITNPNELDSEEVSSINSLRGNLTSRVFS